MEGYSVKIIETSFTDLTSKQRVMLKDTTNAVKIDDVVTPDNPIVLDICDYAVIQIHNENSDDKEYKQYMYITTDGSKYVSGSVSLFTSFLDIYDEMKDSNEEYQIKIYKMLSKNYTNKHFITCSIVQFYIQY